MKKIILVFTITLIKTIFLLPVTIIGGIGNIKKVIHLPITMIFSNEQFEDYFSYEVNYLYLLIEFIISFIIIYLIFFIIDFFLHKDKYLKVFIPKIYVKDIFNINYSKLKRDGYKLIIFDLDNTLGNIKEDICSPEVRDFVNSLTKKFIVVIASNSTKKRVIPFTKDIKCQKYNYCLKPLGICLKKIKKQYKIDYKDMVIVGDQLLTDIFLGNRYYLKTILVDKRNFSDFFLTKFNRKIEILIKKRYKIKEGDYFN